MQSSSVQTLPDELDMQLLAKQLLSQLVHCEFGMQPSAVAGQVRPFPSLSRATLAAPTMPDTTRARGIPSLAPVSTAALKKGRTKEYEERSRGRDDAWVLCSQALEHFQQFALGNFK